MPPTSGLPPRFGDLFGKPTEAFDEAVAAFVGAPSALITCSGTAAMVIAFTALGRKSRRRTVIVPGYTCPLVPLAAARAGLTVVACDTLPGSFELDLDRLAQLANDDTLCVVPTHYGGALTDVARVTAVVKKLAPDAAILEDTAQAFGARWQGVSAGLAGDIGIFSFAAGKGLTLFEGGAMVCRDPALMLELRAVADELLPLDPVFELRRAVELVGYHLAYNPVGLRLVYGRPRRYWLTRGDEIRACADDIPEVIPLHRVSLWRQALGARALRRLPAHLAETRRIFAEIGMRLADMPSLAAHEPAPGVEPSATLRFVTFAEAAQCRAALDRLWRSPLGVSKLFARAIGDYPGIASLMTPSPTPNARDLAARTLTVSTSPYLRDDDRAAVLAAIREAD
ncbi:MAG: aminotransferase class I/II-fold pyridoxal phosphate-dependent enzyme [Rhodomicrobiaceae bacterium]